MSNMKQKIKSKCVDVIASLSSLRCAYIFQNHAASNCYSLLNIFGSILNDILHIQHHMMHSFVNFSSLFGVLICVIKVLLAAIFRVSDTVSEEAPDG